MSDELGRLLRRNAELSALARRHDGLIREAAEAELREVDGRLSEARPGAAAGKPAARAAYRRGLRDRARLQRLLGG